MKVSLCIPTYNLEDKIEKCLESLVSQTMDSAEYEIIIVDDCSKDNTMQVATDTLKKLNFKNFIIEKLPENSGHASKPRNKSLDLASGEYVYFIDGDDFLYPEAIERMYKLGHENDSDVVIGKYKGINRSVPKDMFRHNCEVIDAEIIEHRLMWGMSILKMFKRSEIERMNLRFDLDEPVGEDVLFFATFLANTNRCSIVGDYDCYAVIGHEGEHLSKRVRPIEDYLRTQRKTITAFTEGKAFSDDQKLRACAKYYTRILKHGKYPLFYRDSLKISQEEKKKWLNALSVFTNEYIPYDIIKYLNKCDKNIFLAIYDENMLALRMADQIETNNDQLKKVTKEIEELKKITKEIVDETKNNSNNNKENLIKRIIKK